MNQHRIVFIVGMHRSGTSVLSQSIALFGYSHGEKSMRPDRFNPDGYWEDEDIVAFNDRMLKSMDMSWDAISFTSDTLERLQPFEDEAQALLYKKISAYPQYVIKDPRLCLLLNFWLHVAHQLTIPHHIVYIFRHPESVIQSLIFRNEFHRGKGDLLYFQYNFHALKQLQHQTFLSISFEDFAEKTTDQLRKMATFLGVEKSERELQQAAEKILKPEYIHTATKKREHLQMHSISSALYNRLVTRNESEHTFDLDNPDFKDMTANFPRLHDLCDYIRQLEVRHTFWADVARQRLEIIEANRIS